MAQLPQNADAVIARMKQSPHSSVDGSGGSPDDRDEGRQFKVPHPPLSPENRASSTQVSEISLSNDVIERGYDFVRSLSSEIFGKIRNFRVYASYLAVFE